MGLCLIRVSSRRAVAQTADMRVPGRASGFNNSEEYFYEEGHPMKKLISMLLVLSVVLALAGTALAACDFEKGQYVEFKRDSAAYNAAKSSKKTNNVVLKGSIAEVRCVKGDYVKLRVNRVSNIEKWFKACDLKVADTDIILVVWAKGGKGMSFKAGKILTDKKALHGTVKVTGHTNLRKTPSLHLKSQGVVEKGKCLKLTGRFAADNRKVIWVEVKEKCQKYWISQPFVNLSEDTVLQLYAELFD